MSPNIRKNSEQTFYLMTCKHPRTICAKRFSVLSQTIFQSTENDFQICRHPLYGLYRAEHQIKRRVFSGEYSPLLHLPQTVFHPKRFASFRLLLYQRFKVNFLPLHPSPGFHREMIHCIQIPIYKCKPTGNQ